MQILTNKLNLSALRADSILNNIIKTWVGIALIGQWFFALYIVAIYVLPTLVGNTDLTYTLSPATSSKTNSEFDLFMFFTHIVPAALMAMSGLLQLFPNIRRKWPIFHRYNGRMFFVLGLAGAFTGLYLSWGANFRLSDLGAMGVTLNGILIPIAIFFAWRTAIKKQFIVHQRFAVHSFLLVNGVWSFRLYLMGWYIVNQGSNGNTRLVDGPADIALSFASYLLPMAIAELIFWAKRKKKGAITWSVSIVAGLGTLITLTGVVAATMMMWVPRISMALDKI